MELSEVNQLLQEMEAKEMDLAERIDNVLHECCQGQTRTDRSERNGNIHHFKELEASQKVGSPKRRLNLQFYNVESSDKSTPALNDLNQSVDKLADLSFAHDSLNLHEMDKLASDLNGGQNSTCSVLPQTKEYVGELSQTKSSGKKNGDSISKELDMQTILTNCKESMAKEALGFRDQEGTTYCPRNVYTKVQQGLGSANSEFSKSQVPPQPKHRDVATEYFPQTCRNVDSTSNVQSTFNEMHLIHPFRNTSHVATNTEPCLRKSQHLLALSDFWENNESKTQEEMLSIKLEEEKFRREHCENLIQELQKRLLEQQEKVAVAIRVDNEKNAAICQFQSSWSKLKLRWQALETEHKSLQDVLKNITEKHQTEVSEFQAQIKRNEGELSKALDLAAGYKEKSDNMIKEKVELLKSHADELENYKSMVQEVENRYERMKTEYTKILDKNQQLDETVKNVQQELHRERLRGGEVRSEMAVIHKALDACEAELTVLRQEKENLQLKVKEELNRNNILEQNKVSFLVAVDEARKAERMAKEESKSLLEQQEKIRTELREVYQTQVDEVVKAKLQEFQAQLDAAEGAFQVELETRQRAIAECAARKIKSVIDKHNLEINLLEEKHKEEKRLCEIQLAQSMQQSSMLEAQLNTQKATKSRVVEQLHSVMQKQWQQALQIISGGNVENLSPVLRLNAEKFLESRDIKKFDSITGCCGKAHPEPMRLESQSVGNFQQIQSRESYDEGLISMPCTDDTPLTSRKESKDDLRRYIKMILDMQQSKDEFMTRKTSEDCCSPTPIYREVPRKHYIKKELSMMSEDSITWQPTPDDSLKNTDELLSVPQRLTSKVDQQKSKPPWK
ncbi:golgin subfamily A member 4 isoform X2 [Orussus abietinus]|nr:golgin subfamily A member 4 isoform X2 [Orussus abietinus]XP_012283476.1 golgin subfamily A member 4 isoform X2 [Orussus abietinus]